MSGGGQERPIAMAANTSVHYVVTGDCILFIYSFIILSNGLNKVCFNIFNNDVEQEKVAGSGCWPELSGHELQSLFLKCNRSDCINLTISSMTPSEHLLNDWYKSSVSTCVNRIHKQYTYDKQNITYISFLFTGVVTVQPHSK